MFIIVSVIVIHRSNSLMKRYTIIPDTTCVRKQQYIGYHIFYYIVYHSYCTKGCVLVLDGIAHITSIILVLFFRNRTGSVVNTMDGQCLICQKSRAIFKSVYLVIVHIVQHLLYLPLDRYSYHKDAQPICCAIASIVQQLEQGFVWYYHLILADTK